MAGSRVSFRAIPANPCQRPIGETLQPQDARAEASQNLGARSDCGYAADAALRDTLEG